MRRDDNKDLTWSVVKREVPYSHDVTVLGYVVSMELVGSLSNHDDDDNKNVSNLHI